jgi:TonB family protein
VSKNKNDIDSLTPEIMEQYLQGKLNEDEQYAVEKLMLNSSFESEAMEGFSLNNEGLKEDLVHLNQRLENRIAAEKKNGIAFWLKIAASLTLLAICAYVVVDLTKVSTTAPQVALQEEKIEPKESDQQQVEIEFIVQEEIAIVESPPEKDLIASNYNPKKEITPKQEVVMPQVPAEIEAEAPVENDLDEMILSEAEYNNDMAFAEESAKEDVSGMAKAEQKMSLAAPSFESRSSTPMKKSKMTDSQIKTISGKVTSADDGSPLPGINVILKGSTIGTVTDLEGNYKFDSLPPESEELVFSFIGLASEEVNIENKKILDIALSADVAQLSEVVVTAYGESVEDSQSSYFNAKPSLGMVQYKEYLKTSLRNPDKVSGKVTLKFDIEKDGSLTNFEIKKSLGESYDAEAIRLIKEGSKWVPALKDNKAVKSSARITVKFE